VAPAIPVAVPATTAAASAAALPSASATTTALFGSVAALAVNRTVSTGFKWHRCGLAATGTNHRSASAHAGPGAPATAVAATIVLRMGGSVAAAATLLSLAAWFAASGRRVAAFLEKLLFTSSEDKFLTAVATG
jgi:hypothetical protein